MQAVTIEAGSASPVGSGDPGVVATLDAVDGLYSVRIEAEARSFELAAHFADLHAGDGLPTLRGVGGASERGCRVGGPAPPRIADFPYAELGARRRMSPWSARRYVADALDVRH